MTKEKWIRYGLSALAKHGHLALKADIMVRELGVTRGSFYWHFADIKAFHKAVISHWAEVATHEVIDLIDDLPIGAGRLRALLKYSLSVPSLLESSIRNWAAHDETVGCEIGSIDQRRCEYIAQILSEGGVAQGLCMVRAKIINWVYLGYSRGEGTADKAELELVVDQLEHMGFGS